MAKALNKYEQQHLRNLAAFEKQIQELYAQADLELSYFVRATFRDNPDYTNSPLYQKKAKEIQEHLNSQLTALIGKGAEVSDALSALKSLEMVKSLAKTSDRLQIVWAKEFDTSSGSAASFFAQRKKEGFDISERIWELTEQRKSEMTDVVELAIGQGTSAKNMAKTLTKYLKDPDKAFRRVRDETGKLVESQAWKDFHPGQRVYKNSIDNAFRLSRTEINIAYRTADCERWRQQEFVKAIEIKMSNAGKTCELCKQLAGRYPKDFMFKGWHPSCMCHAVPVLLSKEEYNKYEDYVLGIGSKSMIVYEKELPGSAKKYIQANAERINNWKNKPYWVADNPDYVKNLLRLKNRA